MKKSTMFVSAITLPIAIGGLLLAVILSGVEASAQLTTLWTKPVGPMGTQDTRDMTTDAAGNIYTTGHFYGTVDFDPGVATTYTMTHTGTYKDAFVSKWDPAGNLLWAKQFTGETGKGVAVDGSGNVYVVGEFLGKEDFNPDTAVAATYTMQTTGMMDAFVCKLNSNGDFVWAKRVSGYGLTVSEPSDIVIDPLGSGSLIFTGRFYDANDFDPGSGTYDMTPTGAATGDFDAFVCKWDLDGNFVWANQMGATGVSGAVNNECYSVTVDASGNLFTSCEFPSPGIGAVIQKLDASGTLLWEKQIGDKCYSVATDASGIFITGRFSGTKDLNPEVAGVYNLTSTGTLDFFVTKLNVSGNFLWAVQMPGVQYDPLYGYGHEIRLDVNKNIIVGEYKLDPAGNIVCDGNGGKSTAVDANLDIHSLDGYTSAITKWNCPTVVPVIYATASAICQGSCASITAMPSGGTLPYTYSWSGGGQTGQTINVCPNSTATYTVIVKDAYNNTNTATTTITVYPISANISPASANICQGKSATLTASGNGTYYWLPGGATTSVITPSPTSPTTYTVEVTDGTSGCTKTAVATVNVATPPTVSISGGTTICQGAAAILTASAGVKLYLWSTGGTTSSITVTPSTTASYTVTVSGGGCSNSASATVTVSGAIPTVFISDDQNICWGDTAVISVSGAAASYAWNTGETTSSIAVTPTANTTYSVVVANGNCSTTVYSTVNLYNTPPTITANLSTLASSSSTGNQWYFNGNPISGATSQFYNATQSGFYTVCVTDVNSCTACSDIYSFTVTGISEDNITNSISVYPNPGNGVFTVRLSDQDDLQGVKYSLEIYNSLGKNVYSGSTVNGQSLTIDLSSFSKGIYFMKVESMNTENIFTEKIIIQ